MASEPATPSAEREITRGIIAIYKDYLGRGPSDAWTLIADQLVATTVSGSMTKAEKSLVKEGQAQVVREMRRHMQNAMREDITGLIQAVVGKTGSAFLSDHDAASDIAIETMIFRSGNEGS